MNVGAADVLIALACSIAIGAAGGFIYAALLPPSDKRAEAGRPDSDETKS